MKYGVRYLVAHTQSLKSSCSCFICLKQVGYSQHHLKSMFLNIFCPFVWERSILLSFVFFFVFFLFCVFAFFDIFFFFFYVCCVFLEIMEKGVMYLVALTPSYLHMRFLIFIKYLRQFNAIIGSLPVYKKFDNSKRNNVNPIYIKFFENVSSRQIQWYQTWRDLTILKI